MALVAMGGISQGRRVACWPVSATSLTARRGKARCHPSRQTLGTLQPTEFAAAGQEFSPQGFSYTKAWQTKLTPLCFVLLLFRVTIPPQRRQLRQRPPQLFRPQPHRRARPLPSRLQLQLPHQQALRRLRIQIYPQPAREHHQSGIEPQDLDPGMAHHALALPVLPSPDPLFGQPENLEKQLLGASWPPVLDTMAAYPVGKQVYVGPGPPAM